jgi:hypothetical protein
MPLLPCSQVGRIWQRFSSIEVGAVQNIIEAALAPPDLLGGLGSLLSGGGGGLGAYASISGWAEEEGFGGDDHGRQAWQARLRPHCTVSLATMLG